MNMNRSRRPAADLIEAIVQNMRSNLEELRYTTIAPSRYTVYVSPAEHARLEGIIPRLQAETLRALNEELSRQNRRGKLRNVIGPWLGRPKPLLDTADARWHVEFLPDLDGVRAFAVKQRIVVQLPEILDQHAPRPHKKVDFARMTAADVLRHHRNALTIQIFERELRVARTDITHAG